MTNTSGIFVAVFVMIVPVFSQDSSDPAGKKLYRIYFYITPDGGYVEQRGGYNDDGNYRVNGSYTYRDPTSNLITVKSYVNESGYRSTISIIHSSASLSTLQERCQQIGDALGKTLNPHASKPVCSLRYQKLELPDSRQGPNAPMKLVSTQPAKDKEHFVWKGHDPYWVVPVLRCYLCTVEER